MKKYEELYNHSKYVFDEEASRFSRVEDKAARFITVVTSLLAVYALTGRLLFGDFLPVETPSDIVLIVLASLVLLGLLASWGFAFQAMHIQGLKKAPLNDELLSFYNDNELINIYYSMSKRFSEHLVHNRSLTNLKAKNIKRSFWLIVSTVVFFALFILSSAINANLTELQKDIGDAKHIEDIGNNDSEATTVVIPEVDTKEKTLQQTTPETQKPKLEEESLMSGNDNDTDAAPVPDAQPEQPAAPVPERPDLDVVAPDFDTVTESFDPSKLPTGHKSKE